MCVGQNKIIIEQITRIQTIQTITIVTMIRQAL